MDRWERSVEGLGCASHMAWPADLQSRRGRHQARPVSLKIGPQIQIQIEYREGGGVREYMDPRWKCVGCCVAPTPRWQIKELRQAFAIIFSKLTAIDGVCNKVLLDDKGLVVLCVFGLPYHSHEDDVARSVEFATHIAHKLERVTGRIAVGISRQKVCREGASVTAASETRCAPRGAPAVPPSAHPLCICPKPRDTPSKLRGYAAGAPSHAATRMMCARPFPPQNPQPARTPGSTNRHSDGALMARPLPHRGWGLPTGLHSGNKVGHCWFTSPRVPDPPPSASWPRGCGLWGAGSPRCGGPNRGRGDASGASAAGLHGACRALRRARPEPSCSDQSGFDPCLCGMGQHVWTCGRTLHPMYLGTGGGVGGCVPLCVLPCLDKKTPRTALTCGWVVCRCEREQVPLPKALRGCVTQDTGLSGTGSIAPWGLYCTGQWDRWEGPCRLPRAVGTTAISTGRSSEVVANESCWWWWLWWWWC